MKHPFDISYNDKERYDKLLLLQKKVLSDQISRNRGLGLINTGLYLFRLIYHKAPSKSTVKIIRHYAYELNKIQRFNGWDYLVRYLKTSAVMLQQYVARNATKHSSRDIGKVAVSCTRTGLPRIIPRLQRELIRKGHVETITF